ncbi:hypothetical protein FISHEDRAFT_74963 [Fistulina hepatica ATCC 64428]|uniref:Uncharacterized protein n=1 Tax=Fistulina hepatica ATCC 64428 TaxID=1128425 RepID=A0A0D7A9R9_9AGAR|nr:hypothetical protein FISHEDRAFT_74963 [Fistulina hepatica ATCC 64428]
MAEPSTIEKGPASISTRSASTSDSLQVAAQAYSWLYMSQMLEKCFQDAEGKAQADLEALQAKIIESETSLADDQARFENERLIQFYEGLQLGDFAEHAPAIMQSFLTHGEDCTKLETEALTIASKADPLGDVKSDGSSDSSDSNEDDSWLDSLRVYDDLLGKLETLLGQATDLETRIERLAVAPPSEVQARGPDEPSQEAGSSSVASPLIQLFTTHLPRILRARKTNIEMALDLVDGAREMWSVNMRMESLGL